MLDLIIRGGQVITPWGVGDWDVAIQGEKIVAVAAQGAITDDVGRIIDASGKIVSPGGIEPHAHIAAPIMGQGKSHHRAAGTGHQGRSLRRHHHLAGFRHPVPRHRPQPSGPGAHRSLAGQLLRRLRPPPDDAGRDSRQRSRATAGVCPGRLCHRQDFHHQHSPSRHGRRAAEWLARATCTTLWSKSSG